MIFLPIAERELRVASRKRSTFWVRVGAAIVALVIGNGFLLVYGLGSTFGPTQLGRALFSVMSWLCLAGALCPGLFFTSDTLSEEKREGTLGFLFLTDLRGYDVVFGKLAAASLRAFYPLLAAFPILGITLLMGGVTGLQFWKTALALLNALFVSLVAGLFASVLSRDSQRAFSATLFLLLLWTAMGPTIDSLLSAAGTVNRPLLSVSSPGYLFVAASAWGRTPPPFWWALFVNQALAWLLFALTCLLVPRTWQERSPSKAMGDESWARWWRFGGVRRRARLREKLLDVNPIMWLASRERWQTLSLWVITGTAVAVFVGILAVGNRGVLFGWSYLIGPFALILYLAVASQSGRFFVEAQRNGLLELLLETPVTPREIVQGQWHALKRMFGAPLVVFVAAQLVGVSIAQYYMWSGAAAAVPTPAPTNTVATNTIVVASRGTAISIAWQPASFALVNSLGAAMTTMANFVALIWFGMWMGLNSKNSNLSTLKTIAFVQIIPWFAISFASNFVIMALVWSAMSRMMNWFPILSPGFATALYLAKDAGFIIWSRQKLYSEFRERASRSFGLKPPRPPPVPQPGEIGIS